MKRIHKQIILFLTLSGMFCAGFFSQNSHSLFAGDNPFQSPASNPQSVEEGKKIFFEYCSGCHGRRADGRGPQALNLLPKPQNLRNAQFVKYLTNDRMYTSISGGVRGTAMQAFEMILTPEKRWNVIHYIRSLTADDTLEIPNSISHLDVLPDQKNPMPPSETSVNNGKKLFYNYCSNCHGSKADGTGIISKNLIPRPRNLVAVTSWGEKPFVDYISDARLFDSITNGVPGTSMLPWIGVMTNEERWDIVNFLRSMAKNDQNNSAH